MTEGTRWAICRPGERSIEITSGETFYLELDGQLRLTRMEFRQVSGPMKGRGEYYSADGYWLREGLRAATVAEYKERLFRSLTDGTVPMAPDDH